MELNIIYPDAAPILKLIEEEKEKHGLSPAFSEEAEAIAAEAPAAVPDETREDFRDKIVFTIDSAVTRDMDDAVSLEPDGDGWLLGVHIADVGVCVPPYNELDDAAVDRAVSVYLPGEVIPMLPESLTQSACSIVEGEDRNAVSVMIRLNAGGEVLSHTLTRSVIRSRVKGIYDEVDALLDGTADDALREKYAAVADVLPRMAAIADALCLARLGEDAERRNYPEPHVTIREGRLMILPTAPSVSGHMVEEFMILANRLTAQFMLEHGLPIIYRTQSLPGDPARYRVSSEQHADLAMGAYCHFTSPIRRYADIMAHRVLGYYFDGYSAEEIMEMFEEDDPDYICETATDRSREAASLERALRRRCYALFFNSNRNAVFTGEIAGFDRQHRPILRLDDYNITVIGSSEARGLQGKKLRFRVNVDAKNGLSAYNVRAEEA